MNQQPSQLLQDNDGHWYLVNEEYIEAFETAIVLMEDSDEDVVGQGYRQLTKIKHLPIDDPSNLRILVWEEME